METKLCACNDENIAFAARLLQTGQVVGMPTETVYGLAADAFNAAAVERIFAAKGRPQDNPVIVHIADFEALPQVAKEVPKAARLLAGAFWPGPLTLVLPAGPAVAPGVTAGLKTVGVRLPAHPCARALIKAAGRPLAAPSANTSGRPSPTTAGHVLEDLGGRIPLVLDGGVCPVGVESTVLSLAGPPTVLRPGFVTRREISEVLSALGMEAVYAPGLESPPAEDLVPQSPGMKYRHYAPRAEITIIDADLHGFIEYISSRHGSNNKKTCALCFEEELPQMPKGSVAYGHRDDAESQAAGLFGALRALDEAGAEMVYARMPQPGGVGRAVYNRLLRAAAFRVVRL